MARALNPQVREEVEVAAGVGAEEAVAVAVQEVVGSKVAEAWGLSCLLGVLRLP